MLWFVTCALAILVIAGAFVLGRARSLRRRHERVLAQAVPEFPERERLVDAKASLFHGTRFDDGQALLVPAWTDACVGDLWCTSDAVFLKREEAGPDAGRVLVWPMAWLKEALIVRQFAPLAGKDLPMLRLRFVRGGETLVSEFSLKGGLANLEKLRKQLHLLAGQGATLVQLGKFLNPPEAPPK
ncbi:MAG: hypothetical protein JST92_25810 [Deltaproteobacteria bacterium]|nr:hypothetical protein [Deltaproteobacteria bacterium]